MLGVWLLALLKRLVNSCEINMDYWDDSCPLFNAYVCLSMCKSPHIQEKG